ncbi:head protein [Haloarcula hispanica icosahedral virus 2]|uniref:VP2 n=1 Tax=Haloarcula hispanica icosahedral virus 2 TaxID=1154689 RepID=H9AZX5_9VIRU|nr:head protein [Haloarcula hispanica icosahedral virus 2]AFD02300.1 VP2 [Haloarcula hispanica icosahedral virus 2]
MGVLDQIQGQVDSTVDAAGEEYQNLAGAAEEATNIDDFQQSETYREQAERVAEADGPLDTTVARVEGGARAGTDFLLDNPGGSVQDTARAGIEALTGVDSEDQGEAAQDLATQYSETTSEALEGTALDNPVTDATVGAFDLIVEPLADTAVTGTTGIDYDDGTTEGTVGAVDLFDVGATVATAGVGKAASAGVRSGAGLLGTAARGSDEGATMLSRLSSRFSGSGDEAASLVDDADGATDDVVEEGTALVDDADGAADSTLASVFDEQTTLVDDVDGAADDVVEDATTLVDDVDGAADDAEDALFGDTKILRSGDDAATAGDEGATIVDDATQAAASGSDEAGGLLGRVSGLGATGAGLADEAGGLLGRATSRLSSLGDDAGSAAGRVSDDVAAAGSRAASSTTGKVAGATAGALAGGALLNELGAFDTLDLTDPQTGETFRLVNEKQYQPTEDRPNGGTLWDVRQDGSSAGYTTILRVDGRNVYILGDDGEEKRTQIPVETLQEAVARGREGGA